MLDRARDAAKARKSPIRAGAVPAKLMIDLARKLRRASGDPAVRQELARYVTQVRVNGWTMRRSGGGWREAHRGRRLHRQADDGADLPAVP